MKHWPRGPCTLQGATGTTTRIDTLGTTPVGAPLAAGHAMYASISDDGRYVAYECVTCGDPDQSNVYVYVADRVTGETRRLGTTPQGFAPDGGQDEHNMAKQMSGDGRYVSFNATSTNLSPNDGDKSDDYYIERIS